MDFLQSILVGLLQGVTEWLPISSTGQGMLALMNLLTEDFPPEKAFSLAILLHIGTLLAVVVRMRSDVGEMISRLPDFRRDKLVQFIVVSSFFTGVVGVPVYLLLKEGFRSFDGDLTTAFIGLLLILTGILLYSSKKMLGGRGVSELTLVDMVLAGLAQGFTPLPGISRSGTTVAVLLFRGIRQKDALRLSFLMSIPAVIGAFFIELFGGSLSIDLTVFFGIFAAFISGYFTIDLLLRFATRTRFDIFCIVFGLIAVLIPAIQFL